MNIKICMLVGLAMAVASPGQTSEQPTARDHYYRAARSTGQPEWIGVRTSILLRRFAESGVTIREVGEATEFRSGDQFRIRVQANVDGYVYLLQSDGNECRLLAPGAEGKRGNKVRAFELFWLPGRTEKTWFLFDNRPVLEGLHILLSPAPIEVLERVRNKDGKIKQAAFASLLKANGSTVDMLFDEKPKAGVAIVPATYYVEKGGRKFLAREFQLEHRRKSRDQ